MNADSLPVQNEPEPSSTESESRVIAPEIIAIGQAAVGDTDTENLESLLTIDRTPSGASAETKFSDAGRDYHLPQIEIALISVLLNKPTMVSEACRLVDASDFHLSDAYGVFNAILHLHNTSSLVTPATVLRFFQSTAPEDIAVWTEFVNTCVAASSNFKHLKIYIKELKRAAAVRGGKDHCPHGYLESSCAELLRARLPETRCVDSTFYQYHAGIWSQADGNLLRAEALAVMPPAHRQSRRAVEILQHVEGALQVRRNTFRGAYHLEEDGRILINADNCVIEVSPKGEVRSIEHSPAYNFTLKLAASFDPDARCELFTSKLEEALPDTGDRTVFQEFCGYILSPTSEYEVSMVCYGPTGTGKSTCTYPIVYVLGEALCGAAGLEELCKNGSYVLPTLRHVMLNLGTELTGTEIEESANYKKLVSGEAMTVRPIYGRPEIMRSNAKLMFLTNHPPRFKAGSSAEGRRLRILPFMVVPKAKDTTLKEALRSEKSGVLNWMLEGLRNVLANRAISEGGAAARNALASFERSNNPVESFVSESCILDPAAWTIKRELFEAFTEWCESAGMCAEKMENLFYKKLFAHFLSLKSARRMIGNKREHCLLGIAVKEDLLPPLACSANMPSAALMAKVREPKGE